MNSKPAPATVAESQHARAFPANRVKHAVAESGIRLTMLISMRFEGVCPRGDDPHDPLEEPDRPLGKPSDLALSDRVAIRPAPSA